MKKIYMMWLDFINFKDDMYNEYLEHSYIYGECDTTIDRINPYGDYEPSNCRWATWDIQYSNKRSSVDIK